MRFYTLLETDYPYLLCNRKNYRALYNRKFDHAIIDSGVMDFIRKAVKEYPSHFLKTWMRHAQHLQEIWRDKLWCVIPDYPDDYNPGQFGDNIEKTLVNIESFLEVDGVEWLPVIQSRYLDRLSFLKILRDTEDENE